MTDDLFCNDDELIQRAYRYAESAHAGQERKYTGEPYVNHAVEVALLVRSFYPEPAVVAAALLHDVVEDTGATLADIDAEFGLEVAVLVAQVTDRSTLADGNRVARKRIDLIHLSNADERASSIKLADLISNTQSIVEHDQNFAVVYLREKRALLPVLWRGHPMLKARAEGVLLDAERLLDAA